MSITKLLSELIKIKSYSGHEENLAAFILKYARKFGLEAETQENNIVIKFVRHSSKALIFNAHLDTVKPGNLDSWLMPPTGENSGVIKKGKLYGLGSSDEKAAIADFLTLAVQLKKIPPTIDVFFVFVTQEEVSGAGSQSFVKYFKKNYLNKYKEVSAVLGEATDLQSIEIGHRGNIFLKITTQGDSGHGSQPKKIKKHAVWENIKVIQKMDGLAKILTENYPDPILGKSSFCLTSIQSDSTSINKVASTCFSTWDIRTTPELHDKVLTLIKHELGKEVIVECVGKPALYGLTLPEAKIVGLFKKLVPSLKVTISPGSNDICYFTTAGIPAITFGPGTKDTIHKPNEFVEIDKVEKALTVYQQLIKIF